MAELDTGVSLRKVSKATPGLASKRVPLHEIPVIDMAALDVGSAAEKASMAADLRRACIDIGFFYIRGHGVPDATIEALYGISSRFFDLPLDAKLEIDIAHSGFNRGYIPMYGEKNNSKSKGDVKETFDMAVEVAKDDPDFLAGNALYGPNQWPSALPAFRSAMEAYYGEITALSHRLYRAFALALDLPEDFFLDKLDKPLDILRILHYPPQPEVLDESQIGTGAHSDFDCFTILHQDPVGGLQALNSDSEWVDAPYREGTFLINVGDMLERWSNGLFVSTVHRVINRSTSDRYSTVFFAAPTYATSIECLPSCVSNDLPAQYGPMSAGDYILSRYDEILVDPAEQSAGDTPKD